jgi:hypothetical protein
VNEQINPLGLLSIPVSQPGQLPQTYFADHSEQFSHDRINRLMRKAKLTPRELRQIVRPELVLSKNGTFSLLLTYQFCDPMKHLNFADSWS